MLLCAAKSSLAMSSSVNGTDGVVVEKIAILDAGAQYGKVCQCLLCLFCMATAFVRVPAACILCIVVM